MEILEKQTNKPPIKILPLDSTVDMLAYLFALFPPQLPSSVNDYVWCQLWGNLKEPSTQGVLWLSDTVKLRMSFFWNALLGIVDSPTGPHNTQFALSGFLCGPPSTSGPAASQPRGLGASSALAQRDGWDVSRLISSWQFQLRQTNKANEFSAAFFVCHCCRCLLFLCTTEC